MAELPQDGLSSMVHAPPQSSYGEDPDAPGPGIRGLTDGERPGPRRFIGDGGSLEHPRPGERVEVRGDDGEAFAPRERSLKGVVSHDRRDLLSVGVGMARGPPLSPCSRYERTFTPGKYLASAWSIFAFVVDEDTLATSA